MSSDNSDFSILGVGTSDGGEESGSADDVESGYSEETFWVEDVCFFENFSDDGDGGVDGVGDDEDVGIGCDATDGGGEVADDGSVGVEQVVTGHARLEGVIRV